MTIMHDVRFGVQIPTWAGAGGALSGRDAPLYEQIDWKITKNNAVLAEKLEYDSIWMADHFTFGRNNEMLEIWTALSALSSLTDRVQLGCLVMCILHREPSVLAKMAATLDHISNGRLILGMGTGWFEPEIRAYGLRFPSPGERISRLKEGVKIMKSMWTDDKPSFKGKYYSIENAVCRPMPIQPGGPPVIIGALGPQMLRAVVEVGDGWNMSDDPSVDLYKNKLAIINDWCVKLGKSPSSFLKTWDGHVVIGKNEKEFEGKIEKLRKADLSGPDALVGPFEGAKMLENCISGTPDQCIKKIKSLVALGISHFSLYFLDYPSSDGLRVFAEEVLPEFR